MANTYECTGGTRLTKSAIDKRIRSAKQEKLDFTLLLDGYISCENCNKSGGEPIDIAHTISVKHAQETGRSELGWKLNNMRFLCRSCHNEFDNNPNPYRELIYKKLNNL